MTDYKEILKKYKFRDELGHPLENCVDYQNLLQAANKTMEQTQQTSIEITMPPYFEDNEPCGYCDREIGKPHHSSCRQ